MPLCLWLAGGLGSAVVGIGSCDDMSQAIYIPHSRNSSHTTVLPPFFPPLPPSLSLLLCLSPQVLGNLGAADIDSRLEEQLIDGILYAFQEQTNEVRDAMVSRVIGGKFLLSLTSQKLSSLLSVNSFFGFN